MADITRNSPQEYRGPLSAKQIADGMGAAIRNAKRLLADAVILFEAKRYPSAISLAILAIEEVGKVSILRGLATTDDPAAIRKAWSRYRDHRSKNGAWILPEKVAGGARTLNDLSEIVERDADHTELINSIKQLGFYTGCYGKANWSEPSKLFDNEVLANFLIEVANIVTTVHEPTAREIELWIKHLKPVWNTKEMSAAVVRYAAEMYSEGLSDTTPDEFAKFIFGEFAASEWKGGKPAKN